MRRLLMAGVLLAGSATAAVAQKIEAGIGGGAAAGLTIGEIDATLQANGPNASPFTLFTTSTRLGPAPFVEGRLGYRWSPRLTLEGTLTVARPTLTASLGGDVENAAPVEATEPLTEYLLSGGASWRLSRNPRRRWSPFVSGGAGVARHVHEGRALVENALDVYAGGGVTHPLGSRSGFRVDGRVHLLSGGVAEGAGVSPRAAASASVFVLF